MLLSSINKNNGTAGLVQIRSRHRVKITILIRPKRSCSCLSACDIARTLFEEQRDAARRRHASPSTSSEASTDVEPKLHTAAAAVASTTAFAPGTQQEAAIRKWADVVTQNVALHDETAARV